MRYERRIKSRNEQSSRETWKGGFAQKKETSLMAPGFLVICTAAWQIHSILRYRGAELEDNTAWLNIQNPPISQVNTRYLLPRVSDEVMSCM